MSLFPACAGFVSKSFKQIFEFTVLFCQGEAGAPGSKGPQGQRGLKVS